MPIIPPVPEAAAPAVKNSQTRFRVKPIPFIKIAFSFNVDNATGLTDVGKGEKQTEKVHFPEETHPAIPDALIGQSKERPLPLIENGQIEKGWLRCNRSPLIAP